jgi:Xaa-Pro dipeptidase
MRDHDGLTFPLAEYQRRIEELRERLRERRVHVMLVSDPENITYLTGYQTTGYSFLQVLVVPVKSEPFMVTRLLEDSNIQPRTWVEHSWPYGDTGDAVQTVWHALKENDLTNRNIGYEKNSYFFPAYQQERMLATLYDCQLYDCTGIVEESRIIKSEYEIEVMRQAAASTEAGMKAGLEFTRVGVTENELAGEVCRAMFAAGGEYPAVLPYITSGPRTLIGHATWEGRTLQPGDGVFLEIGGCYRRYHTAMMRTVILGKASSEARDAEAVCVEALAAMKAMAIPGRTAQEVDHAGREALAQHKGRGALVTRTGYAIGIAFAPSWDEGYILSLKPGEQTVLKENMTFHFIPWLMGVDGDKVMGISDTVRVTKDGGESLFSMQPALIEKE